LEQKGVRNVQKVNNVHNGENVTESVETPLNPLWLRF